MSSKTFALEGEGVCRRHAACAGDDVIDTDRQGLNRRLRRYLRHGMLPQLAAFDTVMRLGSVTRAADALAMAQPTVSGHLRKLSEAIGLALFEPRGRQLAPTAAAWALHAAVSEVFDSLERVDGVLGAMREDQVPGDRRAQSAHAAHAAAELIPMPPVQMALLREAAGAPAAQGTCTQQTLPAWE
jgi:hypothetical protein